MQNKYFKENQIINFPDFYLWSFRVVTFFFFPSNTCENTCFATRYKYIQWAC